nr:NADH dehydrogenase subunit 8 [Namystynia karyoxenos]
MCYDWVNLGAMVLLSSGSRSCYVASIFCGGYNRGEHMLAVYSGGELRCITCLLCSSVCPASAIVVTTGISTIGVRCAEILQVCYFRCIFCGWCDVVCPVMCVTENARMYCSVGTALGLLLSKEMLVMFYCSAF